MYVRETDDQVLTLQVSGKLWMRSLIMRDVETGSEWAHLLGKAMAGKLKDRRLKPVVTDMVTWKAWRTLHPETTVLNMSQTSRNYTSDFYSRDTQKFVFGFEVNGEVRAIPITDLQKQAIHQFEVDSVPLVVTHSKEGAATHLFDAQVNQRTLSFEPHSEGLMKDTETQSVWNAETGECTDGPMKGTLLKPRVGIMSFRKAWMNFHPDSKDVAFNRLRP